MRGLSSKLASIIGLFTPFHKLPAEMLGEIFYQASYKLLSILIAENFGSQDIKELEHTTLLLQRVCHLWPNMTFTTPRLFTQVIISFRFDMETVNPN